MCARACLCVPVHVPVCACVPVRVPARVPPVRVQPRCVRVDTPGCFTWHIHNLPYAPDTYVVSLDAAACCVVVGTTNKKYYKRLPMPEMQLLGLVAEPSRVSWSHAGSTLTVHYSKPPALLAEVRACVCV